MPTQRKIETVADLKQRLERMQVTVVADYRGLSVADMTDLRKKLRDSGAEFVVAKNTLTLMLRARRVMRRLNRCSKDRRLWRLRMTMCQSSSKRSMSSTVVQKRLRCAAGCSARRFSRRMCSIPSPVCRRKRKCVRRCSADWRRRSPVWRALSLRRSMILSSCSMLRRRVFSTHFRRALISCSHRQLHNVHVPASSAGKRRIR